jgi:hypothetical protein
MVRPSKAYLRGGSRLRALSPEPGKIGRRDRLGGLIHEYRAAA